MSLAANALQAALFARLNSELAPTKVYDFVPQAAEYPFVVIGNVTAVPWDSKTEDGQEFTVTLHAFSKGAGKKAAQDIAQSIYSALHHQEENLAPASNTVVLCRCEFTDTAQDPTPDGESDHYFHAVQRFRVITQNT